MYIAFAGINGDIAYYVGDKVKADKKICMVHNDYKSSEDFLKSADYKYFKKFDTIGSISESCVEILKEYFPEFSDKIKILKNITSSKLIGNIVQRNFILKNILTKINSLFYLWVD